VPHPLRSDLLSVTPKSMWPAVKAMLHSVYDQPDATAVHAQFDRLLDYVAEKLPAVHDHLDGARADILAFTDFPKDVWTQIWSNNPAERLNREIVAAPTPSGSSPPARPSSASSALSWPSMSSRQMSPDRAEVPTVSR
jgi:transposase-like protein